ncbi:MAG: HEPN domain-containing protein [Deltaproteobacteria bacterium]|nr:HEPN domain-containing protein [Deltaproteobacteria bacterium]
MPKRYPPDDPREWLNRARSNLARAKVKHKGVYLEDLCFDAQQAAEKAIKALLIKRDVAFPYVHDLAELLTSLEKAGQEIHESIRQAERPSKFAVFTRYPGMGPLIKEKEYKESVRIAERVVKWAEKIISGKQR